MKLPYLFKFATLCLCTTLAFNAFAGDKLIGVINSITTTKSNCAQNVDAGPNSWDGGIYPPFPIAPGALLTMQCNAEFYVATDQQSATAINGLDILPQQLFLTQVGGENAATITAVGPDTRKSACVSILPVNPDAGFLGCKVFERNGKE